WGAPPHFAQTRTTELRAQAAPADRGDQPFVLIETQRRDRQARTLRYVSDIQRSHLLDLKSSLGGIGSRMFMEGKRRHDGPPRPGLIAIGALCLLLASCAKVPTAQQANEAVLVLRNHGSWAWAAGAALIC